jgi:GNAT superfamily N-acetyltransferase
VIPFNHRLATRADIAALTALMDVSIAALLPSFLSPDQVMASFAIMGLDSQLIEDGSYFVIEENGRIVGSGGWSRRATSFGGDHSPGRDTRLLDPTTEAARVRAMYTHPDFTRRGIGRRVLDLCESAARAAGFGRTELVATAAGLPLYRACGYVDVEPFEHVTDAGVRVPLVRMEKSLG